MVTKLIAKMVALMNWFERHKEILWVISVFVFMLWVTFTLLAIISNQVVNELNATPSANAIDIADNYTHYAVSYLR